MIAAIVLVIGLLLLGVQIMDPSSNITIASEFDIPADEVFSEWELPNRVLRIVVYDVPIAGLVLFAAGLIYTISDWLNEKLAALLKSAPPPPTVSEPKP